MKRIGGNNEGVSIEKYRKILNDYETPDERVQERLNYLSGFLRNIIRIELDKYKSERISQKSDNIALKAESQNDL